MMKNETTLVQCNVTGVWYNPADMLDIILMQNQDVMVRLKER